MAANVKDPETYCNPSITSNGNIIMGRICSYTYTIYR